MNTHKHTNTNKQTQENAEVSNTSQTTRTDSEPEIIMNLGLPFHLLTEDEAVNECEAALRSEKSHHVVTANADFVAQAWKSNDLKRIILNSHRILCDGQPLVWMSKLLGKPIPERVAGSDLTPRLLELSAKKGFRVYLFGTDSETMKKLDENLPELYPGLQVVGASSPPYGTIDSWDNESYVEDIRNAEADLLLVCLGFPKQDVWIDRYLKQIGNVSLAIGIGASLDFIAGKQNRAPRWMQKSGMEWFWRLSQDPSRMIGRYAHDLVSLIEIGSLQMKRMLSRGPRNRGDLKFLNGVSLPDTLVIEPENDSDWQERLENSTEPSIVIDCQWVNRINPNLMSAITSVIRHCNDSLKFAALFNAPSHLLKHMNEMKLDQYVATFNSPQSVMGWANAVSAGGFNSSVSVKVPANLDQVECLEALLEDVKVLLKHAPGANTDFLLDISSFNAVSVDSAMFLVNLCEQIRNGEDNAPLRVGMVGASLEVRDTFEMLGLEEELVLHSKRIGGGARNTTPSHEGSHRPFADYGERNSQEGLILAS